MSPVRSSVHRRAVFAAALLFAVLAGRAAAEPALWKVEGPQATVWLFGSVHALKPALAWRSSRMDAALQAADALYLEIPNADDAATLQPLVLEYGLDPARPLSTKISGKDKARLDTLLAAYGASEAQMEPLRPWMVGLTLSVLPIVKAGYDPAASVEHVLTTEARAAGKPVKGFETAEEQIRFFADLPLDQEIAFMDSAMDDAARGTGELDQIVAAWNAGDVAAIGRLMDDDMRLHYPTLYKLLIVDRDRRFAERIAELAKGAGVVFVAVGAAHLAGPDSIQADLVPLGLTAVRQ